MQFPEPLCFFGLHMISIGKTSAEKHRIFIAQAQRMHFLP